MTASTIEALSRYIPPKEVVAGACLPSEKVVGAFTDDEVSNQIAQYVYCYSDLWFGWEFASYLASHPQIPFPAFLRGDDLFLWRAYKYIRSNGKNGDKVIMKALALTSPNFTQARASIESMLLARDTTLRIYEEIENILGIDAQVVRAFEKLFFNVVDRKRENSFICSLVLPEGRLAETKPSYWKDTDQEMLMRRIAYDKGLDTFVYMLGLSEKNPMLTLDASIAAGELNKQLMNTALFYSTLGFYNSPQVEAGRKAIQAALANQANPMADGKAIDIEDTIRNDIIKLAEMSTAARNKQEFEGLKVANVQGLNSK